MHSSKKWIEFDQKINKNELINKFKLHILCLGTKLVTKCK
jgi:hypothetical protein